MGIYFLLLSQFRDSFYNKPVMFIWLYVQENGDEDNSNLALGIISVSSRAGRYRMSLFFRELNILEHCFNIFI